MMLEARAFDQGLVNDKNQIDQVATKNKSQQHFKPLKSDDIMTIIPSQNGSHGDFINVQSSQGNKNPMGLITLKSMTSCESRESQQSPNLTKFQSAKFLNG